VSILTRIRLALLLLLVLLGVGVVGYQRIEGWSPLEALFTTVMMLSTVGYSGIHALSPGGQAFTIVLVSLGVGIVAYLARTVAETVVDEEIVTRRRQRRMQSRIDALHDHVIICGFGRMGQEIAREFAARRLPHVVVDIDPDEREVMDEAGVLHVIGDASDDQVLHAAGIDRARGLVAVAPTDADNIFIVLSARSLNPRLHIVARSVLEQDEHKLRRAGADRVISPYVMGARRIAAAVYRPDLVDYVDLHALRAEAEMEAITVTDSSPLRGRTLSEAGIQEKTGCILLAVRPREATGTARRFVSNPPPVTLLRDGDVLIALGTAEQLAKLERLAGKGSA
jgi:voltage-gated potassium channel